MSGQSQKQKYGEFRVFVEWRRRGKWAIRPEFVPSLAAWLLMLGKRYEKMAQGMDDRNAVGSVPGLAESGRVLRVCIEHVQRLLNMLTENFDNEDWQVAVAEICQLMNIRPSSEPLPEIPPGQFEHLISEPTDGSDTGRSDSDVQLGAGAGASSEEPARVDGRARCGATDTGRIPSTEGDVPSDAPIGHAKRGAKGNRSKRAGPKHDRKAK